MQETTLGPLPRQVLKRSPHERFLGPSPVVPMVDQLTQAGYWFWSDDGANVAVITPQPGGMAMWWNGQLGPVYADIFNAGFTPGAGRLYYGAKKADGKEVFVIDGEAGPEFDAVANAWQHVAYSRDGKRLAYLAVRGNRQANILDNKSLGGWYTGVAAASIGGGPDGQDDGLSCGSTTLAFTPDGRHTAFVGGKGRDKGGNDLSVVVIDGKELGPARPNAALWLSRDGRRWACAFGDANTDKASLFFDGKTLAAGSLVEQGVFSADGKRFAFVRSGEVRGEWITDAVIDGKPQPGADEVLRPTFSPDGKRWLYSMSNGDRWRVVVDGEPDPWHDEVMLYDTSARFSPDSRHYAYAARDGERWCVVVDGQAGPSYAGLDLPRLVFGADGRLIYTGSDEGHHRCQVVVDGTPGPWCETGPALARTPDGRHLAYVVESGDTSRIWVDGEARSVDGSAGWLTWSPDGAGLAWLTRNPRPGQNSSEQVVVDGRRLKAHERVLTPPQVLPDGRVAYVAEGLAMQRFLVIDGEPVTEVGEAVPNDRFVRDGALRVLALRDGRLVRLVMPLR